MGHLHGETVADLPFPPNPRRAACAGAEPGVDQRPLQPAGGLHDDHGDRRRRRRQLLDDGGVKLADFGIAKSVQDATAGMTATGQIIGTAKYLSPEQVEGRPATPASDVYATGVVLYEML
ncbi:MAG: protein kinase, partial [Actinobacteria bacterium]|nr:protein kinase [Actinomycetota bacterium]